MDPSPASPREPEIEFLGTLARRFLVLLRAVFFVAGIAAIAFGIHALATAAGADVNGIVWLCAGMPLVLPVSWLFGRGRWLALAASAILWFGPALLAADHPHGWVLRLFATGVACATMFVWRTLWQLTRR